MNHENKSISVVIPVYNSEECLEELVRRLEQVLNRIWNDYEIILVNDFSKDNSWSKIVDICRSNVNVKGIQFRRNFGQDNAIMAGLSISSGDGIIIMDDDLQHNPDDIPALISGLNNHDVCFADFRVKRQSRFKNFGSWFNDKVANVIIKKPKEIYLSPYKAIKREVVEEILKYQGPYPYIDGLLFRATRNITQVPTEHYNRYTGEGNYTLRKSITVWLKLATNFSVFPLRIATLLGFITSAFGLIFSIIIFFQYLMGVQSPIGWASTVVVVLLMGGIQLMTAGIIGEYVGRMFLHQSNEPQYVMETIIGAKGAKN